jgi:CBS domain-containing protein
MKLVKHILQTKGSDVWSIDPDATVLDAIQLMSDKEVGALPVLEGEKLVGMISERDYTRKVILKGRASKSTPVRDIMSSPVLCTNPEQPIEKCMALMTAKHVRHLPVLETEDDQLVGIISIGDLVKAIIYEQKVWIQDLENYVLENISIT